MIDLAAAALVEALAEVFAGQIAGWRAAGHVGVPLLALPDALPPTRGRCLSCGIPAAGWRCAECLEAVELALVATDADTNFTPPRARIVHAVVAEAEENLRDRHEPWRDEA